MRYVTAAAVSAALSLVSSACADAPRAFNITAPSAVVVTAQLSDPTAVSGPMGGPPEGKGKPENPGNGNGNGHGKPEDPGNGNGNGNGKPEDAGQPGDLGKPDSPGNSDHPRNPNAPADPGKPSDPGTPTKPAHRNVQIRGEIAAIGDGQITIGEQVIGVPESARIERDSVILTFADLQVGDRVHVRATVVDENIVAGQINIQQ
jgi:hypothetical protein